MVEAAIAAEERLTRVTPDIRAALEDFLYDEAELLDQWRLHEWLELFTPQARYLIPTTDKPDGDPRRDLFLVHDDRFLLEQRVDSLLARAAHAEYPHSRTRRTVTNVRGWHDGEGRIRVHANFSVARMRSAAFDLYVGFYRHLLDVSADAPHGYRFIERKAVLDLDALRPHGKVSIIL